MTHFWSFRTRSQSHLSTFLTWEVTPVSTKMWERSGGVPAGEVMTLSLVYQNWIDWDISCSINKKNTLSTETKVIKTFVINREAAADLGLSQQMMKPYKPNSDCSHCSTDNTQIHSFPFYSAWIQRKTSCTYANPWFPWSCRSHQWHIKIITSRTLWWLKHIITPLTLEWLWM